MRTMAGGPKKEFRGEMYRTEPREWDRGPSRGVTMSTILKVYTRMSTHDVRRRGLDVGGVKAKKSMRVVVGKRARKGGRS